MKEMKEKLWNKNYNRVMLTNFTLFFSFYLITPLLPLYLSETFHTTKDTIGIVLSGYTLVALLTRPFSGYLVDSFPRKKVLMICLTLYTFCWFGYLAAESLALFAIIRTIHGGPFGASTVCNSTMAIDVLPSSRRNEGIGYYGISNNLASAIAPTVGVYIYHLTHNFHLLFWCALIIATIGLLNSTMVHATQRQERKPRTILSLDRFWLSRGWYIALNIALYGFCWGIISNYIAIYGKEHLGVTTTTGTFFMLLSAGLIVSRLQGNSALREGRLTHNALYGTLLSTTGYVIFVAIPSMPTYYIAALLIGLGNGHIWPAFQNMIINIAAKDERGTANSTLLTSWDLGMGVGILLGGTIAEHISYTAMWRTMATVHIVGLLAFILITRKRYQRGADR